MLLAPILAALLSLPPCYGEPRDTARLELIARAIAEASSTVDDAAGLLTIGYHESSYCEAVHSGKRKGGHGVGLWQIEPGSRRVPPFAGLSYEETRHAAVQALWLWRRSRQCGNEPARRFASYAGILCDSNWPGSAPRVRLFLWVKRRIR